MASGLSDGTNGNAPRVQKTSIDDHKATFIELIAEQATKAAAAAEARGTTAEADVINEKQMNADNGLQTSTFTVCTRIRPAFEAELGNGEFSCLLACAPRTDAKNDTTEAAVVLSPTISMRGEPKLERSSFAFDHTFGPASSVYAYLEPRTCASGPYQDPTPSHSVLRSCVRPRLSS